MSINLKTENYNGQMVFDEYPFELSNFQKHSLESLENEHNVLVTAPTGCGKTLVAEHVIKKYSKLNNNIRKRKVIYTSPIKALSNCLFNDFTTRFKDISFGILTGDIKYNPDADCVIMTTEILRNLLYNKKIKTDKLELNLEIDIYEDVAAVIFDEVHYISDKGRGRVWEESLILLPSSIQLVMLSATIHKPEIFGKWIQDIKEIPLTLAPENKRVVPLKHYLYTSFLPKFSKKTTNADIIYRFDNKLVEIMDSNKKFNTDAYESIMKIKKKFGKFLSKKSIFNDLARFLKENNLLPSIIFTLSKKKCEQYAKNINIILNTPIEQIETLKIIDKELRKCDNYKLIIQMKEYFILKDLLAKGIAYHHSGVYHIFKETIEILLGHKNKEGKRQPLVKLLFATETFAVGVNMPTKAVCYSGITKYSDDGFRILHPHEYSQMSGRAGRRGIDKEGIAIMLPNLYDLPNCHTIKNMMCGKNQIIQSRFCPNFQFLLKLILTGNNQIMNFIKKSLLDSEITDEANYLKNMISNIEIPDDNFDLCEKYDELVKPNKNNFYKFSQKASKINRKKACELKLMPGFNENYKKYNKFKKKIIEKKDLEIKLHNNNNYIHYYIIDILQFLKNEQYIDNKIEIENYEKLEPESVSIKGIIASQINECNELLFTEIINSKFVDNLNPKEIAILFSIFIDSKSNSSDEMTLESLKLNSIFYDKFKNIVDIANNFYRKIEQKNLLLDLDWGIYFTLAEPVSDWLDGKSLNEIVLKYGIYSGNFVKNIIKLNNIIQDVVKISSILKKLKLFEESSKLEGMLIRDNINTESLYVKVC